MNMDKDKDTDKDSTDTDMEMETDTDMDMDTDSDTGNNRLHITASEITHLHYMYRCTTPKYGEKKNINLNL